MFPRVYLWRVQLMAFSMTHINLSAHSCEKLLGSKLKAKYDSSPGLCFSQAVKTLGQIINLFKASFSYL